MWHQITWRQVKWNHEYKLCVESWMGGRTGYFYWSEFYWRHEMNLISCGVNTGQANIM